MANAGLPTAGVGRVVHNIDYQPAVEATSFEVNYDPPLTPYFGFAGMIAVTQGQAAAMITLKFATVAAKSQFNMIGMIKAQKSGEGFTYDFWEGLPGLGRHWMMTGCFMGGFKMTNDPKAGTTEKSISIMGSVPVEI